MVKILIVDDQPRNLRLIEQIIEDLDQPIQIEKAENGETALNLALTEKFDLILMDIALPDKDGMQVTMQIREGSVNASTPVVAVTAYAMLQDEQIFRQIFQDYVSKPIDEDDLANIIKKWLVKNNDENIAS